MHTVAGKLTAQVPLPWPRSAKLTCCLIVLAKTHIFIVTEHVHSATVQERVSCFRVVDVERLDEGELNPTLAAGERHWDRFVLAEAITGEVELQGTCGGFEGLGRVRRAFEVAVVYK